MSDEVESPDGGPNRVWREFNARAFLSHSAHVQDGRFFTQKCAVCREGFSGMVLIHEIPVPEVDVVQSSGMDEEEASTSAPGSGWSWERENKDMRPEKKK